MKILFMLLPVVYLAGNGYLFVRVWQAMSGVPVWVKVIVAELVYGLYFRAEPRLPQMVPLPHIRLKRTFPLGPSFPHWNP